MPEISRFLGIVITMFYNDHSPPHFHALYGSKAVTISIRDEKVVGEFPNRALKLVLEWCRLHTDELARELGIGATAKAAKANCSAGVK